MDLFWDVRSESGNAEKTRAAESSETEKLTNVMKTSFNLFDSACASSDGGPGLNLGEHMAGRSRFGTGKNEIFFSVSPMRRAEGKGHT